MSLDENNQLRQKEVVKLNILRRMNYYNCVNSHIIYNNVELTIKTSASALSLVPTAYVLIDLSRPPLPLPIVLPPRSWLPPRQVVPSPFSFSASIAASLSRSSNNNRSIVPLLIFLGQIVLSRPPPPVSVVFDTIHTISMPRR